VDRIDLYLLHHVDPAVPLLDLTDRDRGDRSGSA